MKRMKRLLLLLPVLVVAGVLAYQYGWNRGEDERGVIRVSGNIEITDAEVSFKIPGRVQVRSVDEGQLVDADQIVARLDATDLEQEVALRRAEVGAAEAALAELEAGTRPQEIAQAEAARRKAAVWLEELLAGSRPQEIAAAEAEVRRAQAEVNRHKDDYERQRTLHREEVISTREYEAARAGYLVAEARLREAEERLKLVREGPRAEQIEQGRAALAKARAELALLEEGPRQETIEQARARLQQARETLALAETRLGYAILPSPLSGVVLSENVEAGEYVAAGTPVVTVGDLANVWLRAYVNETDLGRVKVGQKVEVTTDTYPDKVYDGRLAFIAPEAEFTPKNVQTHEERVKLVYRIKVEIPNPAMELKPGMPADARILVREGDT
jgi:HlyD family secretion protein